MSTPTFKPGEILYYAQLIDRPPTFPTARLLRGFYSKPGRRPGTHRVLFHHTKFGLDCAAAHLSRDPEIAHGLVATRLQNLLAWYAQRQTAIVQAQREFLQQTFIAWPAEAPPDFYRPLGRADKFIRPVKTTVGNSFTNFKET